MPGLAVASDVHGNLNALEAVIADIERRGIERVVHGGDLALGGCQPAQVLDRITELGWPGVVGNTDEMLWRPEELERQIERAPKLSGYLKLLFEEHAPATSELLGAERLGRLRRLPAEHREGNVVVVHASPGDLWRAPMPDAEDAELVSIYGGQGAGTVVYGHIHRPFVRALGALTVANSGSVGSPLDGDPRASYLVIEDAKAAVVRVEYDVEREASLLLRSGYPDAERIAQTRRLGRFLRAAA